MNLKHKKIEVKVPSNIALIKYWGKDSNKDQWPSNSSISMTLKNCYTQTSLSVINSKEDELFLDQNQIDFSSSFGKKIKKHLDWLKNRFNFYPSLKMETTNSFPESSGIASSASGMAALSLAFACLRYNENNLNKLNLDEISYLARMGSGSACRSLFSGFVEWVRMNDPITHAINQIGDTKKPWALNDLILIVKCGKDLSSSDGHELAKNSPLFKIRLSSLEERIKFVKNAILNQSISDLGHLIEQEALELHSIVMTSKPGFSYFTDQTIELICWVRSIRKRWGLEVYFTLDAGSNPHLIFETKNLSQVLSILKSEKADVPFIIDEVGEGPQILKIM